MKRKTVAMLSGLLLIGIGAALYPKAKRFCAIDACLDKGGSWNFETSQCEYEEIKRATQSRVQEGIQTKGYDELANEQGRKTHTVSEYNTDLDGVENAGRPKSSQIINSAVDTTLLFNVWTSDPEGPHADFLIKAAEFYVVDYDGDGAMPYRLERDTLTVFYNDFTQTGLLIHITKDTLVIRWNDSEEETKYVGWKH